MDLFTALTIGKFLLEAVKEGAPVVEKVVRALRATNEPEAQALADELDAEWQASRGRRDSVNERINSGELSAD